MIFIFRTISVTLLFSFVISAQVPLLIRDKASDIFLTYSKNKTLSCTELDSLEAILGQNTDSLSFEKLHLTSQGTYNALTNKFVSFRSAAENLTADSAMFLFNQWYLDFVNTFYDYFKIKFLESGKTKILFFSASVSCYCTLKMCHDQLTDILDFINKSDDKYDYFVVDSYEHNDLQIEYDTFFAPSVAVLERNNKILLKLEYEEKMKDRLLSFFKDYNN